MNYFVTGATGFIGKRLVRKLLDRGGTVHALVREASRSKLDSILADAGVEQGRIVAVAGDLTQPGLGISEAHQSSLHGKVDHVFHLGAIYDLEADEATQTAVNIEGTRHAIAFAESAGATCFHHVSSIAAAGNYDGVFREDMFDEAVGLDQPYFRTKHEGEAVVRRECAIPYRIYRPGVVVGDSKTGEMEKIDGPYYLFKLIQKTRKTIPSWMPTIGLEGGRWNVVPVDFVVSAIDHIAHQPDLDGKCFHLTDPEPLRVGELLNVFARAGHAPPMTVRINTRMLSFIPSYLTKGVANLPPIKRFIRHALADLGIPRDLPGMVTYPTRFDSREAQKALEGSGICVPPVEAYAPVIWDYWERHLDPDLFVDHTLSGKVRDRVVVVTGASSGIGRATAVRMADAGARVIIVARGEEKLEETREEIEARGGKAFPYTCDLSDLDDCDRLVAQIQEDHGVVSILVNNAGRSIRRSIRDSFDRFHDYQRTMQLNYFGSLRLVMGFLPGMLERRQGHLIYISSIGVLTNAPRFSAYVASKAAMDSFNRCAAAEFSGDGVQFTTINMPLVRTPMIAPTKLYDRMPAITPDEAANMVSEAIISRPKRVATRLGTFMSVVYAIAPKLTEILMNTAFRLFPDSTASTDGKPPEAAETSPEQAAFAEIMRGIHW